MIGKYRDFKTLFHTAYYVQIRQAGFNHNAVCALVDVEGDFAQGFLGIGGVHLVGFLVAFEEPARAHGITERTVKRRRIFGGISHNLDIMVPCPLKRIADRADAAIHHVAWCNNVRPGRCLIERLRDEHIRCRVVQHITAAVDQPVMAMRGIGIERDISQNTDFGNRTFDRPDCLTHQIVGIKRLATVVGAQLARGVGKQRDTADPQITRFACPLDDAVHRPARYTGKTCNRFLDPLPAGDEQWPDQMLWGQMGFGEHRAAPRGRSGAAETKSRIMRHSCLKPVQAAWGKGASCGSGASIIRARRHPPQR